MPSPRRFIASIPLQHFLLFPLLFPLAGAACTDALDEDGDCPGKCDDPASVAPPLLPEDYKDRTYTVEDPLVLEYAFGGSPTNKARLHVVNYPHQESDLFFFHMHVPERTAKATGEEAVRARGGTFMYLTHSSSARNMVVRIGGRRYEFDPNRIFTAEGLEERTMPRPTGSDLEALRRFVAWIEQNLTIARGQRARPMLMALHNNSDDDVEGALLSILTEEELLEVDNRAVNINEAWDIDNFYIATQPATYDALVERHHPNISLRLEHPRDIGYLSNWAIEEGIDYLTVETEMGDLEGNRRMVDIVQAMFR